MITVGGVLGDVNDSADVPWDRLLRQYKLVDDLRKRMVDYVEKREWLESPNRPEGTLVGPITGDEQTQLVNNTIEFVQSQLRDLKDNVKLRLYVPALDTYGNLLVVLLLPLIPEENRESVAQRITGFIQMTLNEAVPPSAAIHPPTVSSEIVVIRDSNGNQLRVPKIRLGHINGTDIIWDDI